jgi:hypothetical protein
MSRLEIRRSLQYQEIAGAAVQESLHCYQCTPWYIGNRQIHDDFEVSYFSDHIRSLRDLTQN